MNLKPGQKIEANSLSKIKQLATDSMAMLSATNQAILDKRRDQMAPHLAKEYRQLKNEVPNDSRKLFGDDIKTRLAAIKAANKATKATDWRHHINYNRNNQYSRFPKNSRGNTRKPWYSKPQRKYGHQNSQQVPKN